MCRKKGRVVLVGDVGLQLNRADFYQKELDFLISSSYGPGRYDRRYEEEGLDYPVAFVRWTENRNMSEYLRMLNERKVTVAPLIEATYPINEAPMAYERLKTDQNKASDGSPHLSSGNKGTCPFPGRHERDCSTSSGGSNPHGYHRCRRICEGDALAELKGLVTPLQRTCHYESFWP